VCGCGDTGESQFGSCNQYIDAIAWMKKNCHCDQAKEAKNEFYQLRKVKIAGQNCTTKPFLKEFPMHTRGVFLVLVNHDHCVVFDTSRQRYNK